MRDFHDYDSLYIKTGVIIGELIIVNGLLFLLTVLFPNAMHVHVDSDMR